MPVTEPPCGAGADNRYCPVFWDLSVENERLRDLLRELLADTGLDEEEQAEWLSRAGIDQDEEEGEPVG